MKTTDILTHPVSLALGAVIVLGAVFGRFEVSVLALLGWIGFAAFRSMRRAQTPQVLSVLDEVSNENRVRIAPIKRLYKEIDGIVAANQGNPAVKVIGGQAKSEARHILEQAVRMLALRQELARAVWGQRGAAGEAGELESRVGEASGDEAAALESHVEARRLEASHLDSAREGIGRIDAGLRQAEAALSELRARLAVSAARALEAGTEDEGLVEAISRLKVLGSSLEEAETLVKGGAA